MVNRRPDALTGALARLLPAGEPSPKLLALAQKAADMSRQERGEFVEVAESVVGMTDMRAPSDVPENISPDDAIGEGHFNAWTEPDGSASIWPAVIAGERLACSDATVA